MKFFLKKILQISTMILQKFQNNQKLIQAAGTYPNISKAHFMPPISLGIKRAPLFVVIVAYFQCAFYGV